MYTYRQFFYACALLWTIYFAFHGLQGKSYPNLKKLRVQPAVARSSVDIKSTPLKFTTPLNQNHSPHRNVSFIVQIHNDAGLALARIQYQNLVRFVANTRVHYHLVLSSSAEALRKKSDHIAYLLTKDDVFLHHCPTNSLSDCMDYTFKSILKTLNSDLFVHLNVDMFLVKLWDPFDYMFRLGNPSLAAVIEDHTTLPPYVHPGLIVANLSFAAKFAAMTWENPNGADTGGHTSSFLLKNPDVIVKPMVWSRHFHMKELERLSLVPEPVRNFVIKFIEKLRLSTSPVNGLAPDIYTRDFAWLHFRDISCWSGCSKLKKQVVKEELPQFISSLPVQAKTNLKLIDSDFSCWACSTTTTGFKPRINKHGWFMPALLKAPVNTIQDKRDLHFVLDRKQEASRITSREMQEFYDKADEISRIVASRKPSSKLPLPKVLPTPRSNLNLRPPRYEYESYKRETSYYWRYAYNGTQDLPDPEVPCQKGENQRYWAVTYASGEVRNKIARLHTRPSCLLHGVDEVLVFGPNDLDYEYKRRNHDILSQNRGVGLWIWKHYVQYKAMINMKDGDILLYIDSDFRCDPSILQYFCLAQKHDVVGFHHSNSGGYKLAKLASRDSMILMGLDTAEVATSVQSSGGNVLFKKTPFAMAFIREMAGWSQQIDVVGNRGKPSKYGVDWPEYVASGYNHQCDQAISSLMFVKYGVKTFPWHMEGFGAGSDDALNRMQRKECGLNLRAMTIHVRDNLQVSWIGSPNQEDLKQIKCMQKVSNLDTEYGRCLPEISRKMKDPESDTIDNVCLQNVDANMPMNAQGVMKAHQWDARTGKWNEEQRWLPMQLNTPCTIWYVGANTHGRDGVRLQNDYTCTIHVFEPVPIYSAQLKKNWQTVPRSAIHAYGLGANDRVVNGVKQEGESTFAMKSEGSSGATVTIRNASEVFYELGDNRVDLLHVNCEGCEWELFETLINQQLVPKFRIIQFSAHWFKQIENIKAKYCKIEKAMKMSHTANFQQPFGWERWSLK